MFLSIALNGVHYMPVLVMDAGFHLNWVFYTVRTSSPDGDSLGNGNAILSSFVKSSVKLTQPILSSASAVLRSCDATMIAGPGQSWMVWLVYSTPCSKSRAVQSLLIAIRNWGNGITRKLIITTARTKTEASPSKYSIKKPHVTISEKMHDEALRYKLSVKIEIPQVNIV